MKIIHLIPSLLKGGAERLSLDICTELNRRKGVEARLVTFEQGNEFPTLSKTAGHCSIEAVYEPSFLRKANARLDEWEALLDDFKPDVIHTHLFRAEMLGRVNPREGVSYFSHLHDNMSQFDPRNPAKAWKQRLTESYEKRFLIRQYQKCNNRFLAISRHTEDYFRKHLPARAGSITAFPNAISTLKFKRPDDSIPAGNRLVSVGSLVDKKNQLFLLDVADALLKRSADYVIDVLGDGPNRTQIQEQIDRRNLNERVILHGNVDAVEEHLHGAFACIHPALYEPFGLVILEANAAGLPVIALDGKGNRDIMKDGHNGYLIAEPNPGDFADRIIQLRDHTELLERISRNAVEFAGGFDIGSYTDRLLELYHSARQTG